MREFRTRITLVIPTQAEVREQLSRLLESSYFKNSVSQSELLVIVVEKTLAGETINETDLTPGSFRSESTRGRANASIVRKKLESYYQAEGKDDFVYIELPPGASYKAQFTLNGGSLGVESYLQGLMYRSDFSLRALHSARRALYIADQMFGNRIASALIVGIETDLLIVAVTNLLAVNTSMEMYGLLGDALNRIDKLRKHFPDRPYLCEMFISLVAVLKADWSEAEKRMASAFKLNQAEVEQSLWYAFYLSVFGRWSEAEKIVMEYVYENPFDPGRNLLAAALYYHMREYNLASVYCSRAFEPGGGASDACHLLNGLIALECGFDKRAWHEFREISTADWCEETELELLPVYRLNRVPGLIVLAAQRMNKPELAEQLLTAFSYPKELIKPDTLHGPPSQFTGTIPPREWKPVQTAFALMATGDLDGAVNFLGMAYQADGMAAVWPPTLPIFDPLRNSESFKALVEEIGYPSAAESHARKLA